MDDMRHQLPPAGRPLPSNHEYLETCKRGYEKMAESRVVLTGLARTLGDRTESTAQLMEAIGQCFMDYGIVVFENDSTDDTPKELQEWAASNPRVHVTCEKLNRKHWPATRELGRMRDLAEYRNRARKEILTRFPDFDYVIVVDMDLSGWSIDGIANTFGREDWDFTGSVSWRKMEKGNWVHYDVWAFRNPTYEPLQAKQVNPWLPRIGEAPIPVKSCFGGLGIYRMEAYKAACYDGTDCEHVCLHQQMAQAGYGRQFINPSQVTVY